MTAPRFQLPRRIAAALCTLLAGATLFAANPPRSESSALQEAIGFLTRAVPAWSRENRCFSCHHNGDAAAALFLAHRAGYVVPRDAIRDTLDWLAAPERWDTQRGAPEAGDARLARLQFSRALTVALNTRLLRAGAAHRRAARALIQDQAPDGSFPIDAHGTLGSPATYGTPLATAVALEILQKSGAAFAREPAARALRWLVESPPSNVPAAAAIAFASPRNDDPGAARSKAAAIKSIRAAQASDGGWGPYPDAPAEAFDTALALISLHEARSDPEILASLERGRRFLLSTQLPDGSWVATTRPTGGESYAQQTSTTAWVLRALLAGASPPRPTR